MSALAQTTSRLLALCDSFAPLGLEPACLAQLRAAGRDAFAAGGLPTRRQEAWRHTSLKPLAGPRFRLPSGEAAVDRGELELVSSPVFACSLLVFVDGHHRHDLSTPHGFAGDLRVESLRDLCESGAEPSLRKLGALSDLKAHPFAALNTALLDDGAVVRIPAGTQVEHVIHLVFVSCGGDAPLSSPRVWIEAGPGSRAVVLQDHVVVGGSGPRLTNAVTEVDLAEDACLDLVVLQRESDATLHFSNLSVQQARGSRMGSHVLTLGGRLVRNDISILLAGEGAEARLSGLFLGAGDRLVDNHTLVDHAVPHCSSHELYKGILAGRSRGVFRGRILVRPDAQKTNARQSNPNLLLDDGAEIDTQPQLEIHANDVKCSHGSAIGRMDEDALFYLRSRGIDLARARRLLTRGFAAEMLRALPGDVLGEALGSLLSERLDAAEAGA